MEPKRRRWLTVWGLFLATAFGAVAYLAARRIRGRREISPEEASVADLSARLRQEAAAREKRARRRPAQIRWPALWKHRRSGGASPQQGKTEAGPPAPGEAPEMAEPPDGAAGSPPEESSTDDTPSAPAHGS